MSTDTGSLSGADVVRLLPHRHPVLLLDGVSELIPGEAGTGLKNISISDPVFAGHFPGEPIYPGAHLIEVSAQVAAVILNALPTEDGEPRIGYLATVKRFAFTQPIRPGDQVSIHVEKKTVFGLLAEFSVVARVKGAVVAKGSIVIATAGR
ncbi:3-hydroxyacyl-ACP dehydratase FabZ [Leifsonia sp. McL0607]|uniref:3-hydroxyacyl-ACP dehydratase FabZ n=1 Tax=Leifsonia sp. McL0607 TaxID=3415672 RepID=UPI003CE89E1E